MFDKQATRANILANLKTVITNAIIGDLIVIQYSGHGTQIPDVNGDEPDRLDECWVPYDIYTNGPISDDEIWKIFRSKQSGVEIIMVSDSCHSGTVARAFGRPSKGKAKYLPSATFLNNKNEEWNMPSGDPSFDNKDTAGMAVDDKSPWPVLLLSGCQDHEYSYDAYFNKANGAFSYHALRQLKTLPKIATYLDWYQSIKQVLPSNDYPQTPNMVGSYQGHRIFA
jgi:hypothetical protein